MPEPGNKKRPTQQTGSGKLSKRGVSIENASLMEALTLAEVSDTENQQVENPEEPEVEPPPLPEPVKDIMRCEPVLFEVFVEQYEGERDSNGFYHGEGMARLKDGMIYTGIFEHGKMDNHGVLQWDDGTIYSGDFVLNVITGKGQYVWSDGSTYEGDVVTGLRDGDGTFTCVDGKSYTGQWKTGKRHGKGCLYYDESGLSYYSGDWVENEKCGYGLRRFHSGNVYEGEWRENIRNGEGKMYWYDKGEEYFGNWDNGIQHGLGEYSWYLKRVSNSQYPLRNKYVGDFVDGERHGNGMFHYASGAMYDGEWKHDMKHGQGKFTFKNGSVFVGQFHNDHMIDFPDLILPRMMTPDIQRSGIPVTSSTSLRSKSVVGMSGSAVDAFLDIELDDIFYDYKYDLEQRQEQVDNIMRTILRYTTKLKNIYKIYSCLGSDLSADNTFVMSKLHFLRFLKDYNVHRFNYTLAQIERYLEDEISVKTCFKKLFIRDFLNHLVKISYLLFNQEVQEDENAISNCFSRLISHIMLQNNAIKGYIFKSIKHTEEIYRFVDQIFEVYFYFRDLTYQWSTATLCLRDILHIFKDMTLINEKFNSTALVNILTEEERDEDGYYNLDKELTPFEFLEVVTASASHFVSDDLIEEHSPNSAIIPSLSLNLLPRSAKPVTLVPEETTDMRGEDLNNLEAVNQDVQEDGVLTDSNIECVPVSPVKSTKSSGGGRTKRVTVQGKKVEKETSNTNMSKANKKDGSKSGKSSSLKLDEGKIKSPNGKNIDWSEGDVNTVAADKSCDSTIEHVQSSQEHAQVSADSDIPVESSLEMEVVNRDVAVVVVDNDHVIPAAREETFQVWSMRLHIFLTQYFFPQYEKRKMLEEMLETRRIKLQ